MVEMFEKSSGKPERDPRRDRRPTDEDLIERFQNGDVYAFDLIVKRYKEQLLNFVYRCVRHCSFFQH